MSPSRSKRNDVPLVTPSVEKQLKSMVKRLSEGKRLTTSDRTVLALLGEYGRELSARQQTGGSSHQEASEETGV